MQKSVIWRFSSETECRQIGRFPLCFGTRELPMKKTYEKPSLVKAGELAKLTAQDPIIVRPVSFDQI